jgi:PAS domain S-box-containing protein
MDPERGVGGRAAPRADHDRELLTLLIDSVTDYAIYTLDLDGRILTWNRGAERLKGYTHDEAVGQHMSLCYEPSDVEAGVPDRELAIAAAEGRFEDEGWRLRKGGGRFWANVVVTALRGPDERLVGFGKVTRDLTERKVAEDFLRESEERFRLLVAAVSDYAIFLLNPDGTIASWNLGAERLKGYRAEEIIGRHISTFYGAADREAGLPDHGLATALAEGRWESEGWRVRKDGTRFWADVVITALRSADGQHRGFAKVTRDLTDRKRNEDALRGVLERERETAARLREIDQMKTDLVAVVAHDLRGPVGIIQSMLHLLVTDWAGTPDAEKRDLLDRMVVRTESLGSLVDDLFDMAKIDAGQLTVDAVPIDVAAVVAQVAADATVGMPDRKLVVHGDRSAVAVGDERRTGQVLMNLIGNALKFSPVEAPIELQVETVDDEVVVSVVDHGPGIPTDQEHLLFTRFGRLSQSSGTPGSGMGLFISKSLVEAQGGRLWVESGPDEGSTFRFTLPAER